MLLYTTPGFFEQIVLLSVLRELLVDTRVVGLVAAPKRFVPYISHLCSSHLDSDGKWLEQKFIDHGWSSYALVGANRNPKAMKGPSAGFATSFPSSRIYQRSREHVALRQAVHRSSEYRYFFRSPMGIHVFSFNSS